MENLSRRAFLKSVANATGAVLVPDILLKASQEKNTTDQEMIVMNPDEIPQFLKGYHEKYPTWVAKAEQQRARVGEYFNSKIYKDKLSAQFKKYFSGQTEEEALALALLLYEKRIEVFKSKKIKFESLSDGQKGFYNPGNIFVSIDTLNAGPSKAKDGSKTERYDLFATAHEYCHTVQSHDLMFVGTFESIIDSMLANGRLAEEKAKEIKEKVLKKSKRNKLLEQGRVDIEDEDKFDLAFYSGRPSEAMGYMMQIRITLDTFSATHPEVLDFDMTKDEFTKKHLEFIKENRTKLFQSMTLPKKGIKDFTIADAMIFHFGEEKLIELMNQV